MWSHNTLHCPRQSYIQAMPNTRIDKLSPQASKYYRARQASMTTGKQVLPGKTGKNYLWPISTSSFSPALPQAASLISSPRAVGIVTTAKGKSLEELAEKLLQLYLIQGATSLAANQWHQFTTSWLMKQLPNMFYFAPHKEQRVRYDNTLIFPLSFQQVLSLSWNKSKIPTLTHKVHQWGPPRGSAGHNPRANHNPVTPLPPSLSPSLAE